MTPATGGYRLGLLLSLVLYVSLYGGLLASTKAMPYVMDNNESFSAFVHAQNLYRFPISRTLGLTDEAFSPDEAAHPYIYTHQGNFPRVFAFALYVLGARTIESQIVITTFTIGLLSVLLIYHYFTRIGSPLFAFIATAVTVSDYVFFVQWQVNTFRVWHGVFLFLSLLCVHGIEGARRRQWLLLTFVSYACMFYFELVFATFVAVMAGLYAGVRHWNHPRLLVQCWSVQGAGAALAVAVLVGQLVGYLGWADFVEDLRLTYTARNLVAEDPTYVDRIRDFVESRRLVFWYNFASVEYRRSPWEILSSITQGYFNVFTPTLWYFVTIVITGWFAGLRRSPQAPSLDQSSAARVGSGGPLFGTIPGVLLIVAWTRFLLAVVQTDGLAGIGGARLSFDLETNTWIAGVAAVLAVGCVGVIGRIATGQWSGLGRLPAARVILAAATLLLAEHVLLNSAALFDSFFLPLWSQVQGTLFPGWVVQLALIGAAGVAVLLTLNLPLTTDVRWSALASYIVCGLLAYVVVYMLSPGYVHSGYLQRSVPFGSFVLQTSIALTIYLVCHTGYRSLRPLSRLAPAALLARPAILAPAAAWTFLLLFPTLFWVKLQATHAQLLPATHFGFIKQLGEAPFRGASFAADTYAAPIYAYTGQWAYFDTRLGLPGGGTVTLSENGYVADRDARSYLWLADRWQNEAYQRPAYFLCFRYQDLRTAVYRIRGVDLGCSSAGTVKHASERKELSVAHEIVARDPSGNGNWAIVSLDWSVLDQRAVKWRRNPGLE